VAFKFSDKKEKMTSLTKDMNFLKFSENLLLSVFS